MARRAYERTQLDETFRAGGWREEADTFYRQRKSVWFVLACMIGLSAFWTNPWAYVAFFSMLALYSAVAGVRIGVVCGLSFTLWFLGIRLGWLPPGSTENRVAGLWAIATLFLLVVWKADGVHRLRDRYGGRDANAPHD